MNKKILCLLVAALNVAAVRAQVVLVPPGPQIGSRNPITAYPAVARPHTQPCRVALFQNLAFADFSPKIFNFTPPAACPGPWAKVVFSADFTVTAGRQFDRTAAFYLGHANLFYGTTAEPRSTLSPSWHVERDVTDLRVIFESPQSGEADLGNFVGVSGGVDYTGIIYADAALEFYPAEEREAVPATPDVVIPLPDAAGGAATLNGTASLLSQSVTLPRNTERVYLDVIAQSQSNDEFWYTCVPNDVAAELQSCGNTAFRETEITVDGVAAGVAPVYPWIYTGGIDPYLWAPIPGVQTLDFPPYRVDLTPFAGLLADGNPHTLGISVYNADGYFLATANLLAFSDPHAAQVMGGVTKNTLAAPAPAVTENLATDASGNISGSVLVTSARSYVIEGWVEGSRGRVVTRIESTLGFSNTQAFTITASQYVQNVTQSTTLDSTTSVEAGGRTMSVEAHLSYPFTLGYSQIANPDGTLSITTTSEQQDWDTRLDRSRSDGKLQEHDTVSAVDTLQIDATGAVSGHTGTSSQHYVSIGPKHACFDRSIAASAGVLTTAVDAVACRSP